jgi:hypothetical protein
MGGVGKTAASVVAILALSCSTAAAHKGTAPHSATALAPGVHVDPGSPATKEYAIPLTQASQVGGSSNGSSTPTFGAGISSGSQSHHASGHRAGASSNGGTTKAHTGASAPPAATLRASSGSDGSLIALLGGGAVILLLGGVAGAVLWRSRRATGPG